MAIVPQQLSNETLSHALWAAEEKAAPANRKLNHLEALEAESIHILREAAAEFSRPVMLYSIGKDSSVMLRLAEKAFFPGRIPFPLLHVDTSYKFPEMIEFQPGGAGRRRESIRARNAKMLRLAENKIVARCACRRRLQRSVRWRETR